MDTLSRRNKKSKLKRSGAKSPKKDEPEKASGGDDEESSSNEETRLDASPGGEGDERFTGLSRRVLNLIEGTKTWIFATFAICLSPALAFWPFFYRSELEYIIENELARNLRYEATIVVGISLIVMGLLYASRAIPVAKKEGWAAAQRRLERLNDRLLGLLVLPFIPSLFVDEIETRAPFFTVILAAGAALMTCVAVMRYPKNGSNKKTKSESLGAVPSWAPLTFVLVVSAIYAIFAAKFSINIHHNFYTADYDLGIYDNIVWNSLHGRVLACAYCRLGTHVSAHVDPILLLFSPLYIFWPRAETLLIAQAIWLASTTIPVYYMGKHHLGRPWVAAIIACSLLLYPGMHGAQFYQFHSLSLVAPLLAWMIYCLETGKIRAYWVFLALFLLCREDMSILSCFVAFYAILSRKAVRVGLITIGVAIVYFAFLKIFVMPDPSLLMSSSSGAYSYSGYYRALIPHGGEGAAGMLISLLTNPFFVIRHVFSPEKLTFLALLYLPVMWVPVFARRGKVMMLYGLAFMLLASKDAVYSVHFQYPSVLYPVIFMLAPLGLSRLDRSWKVNWLKLDTSRLVTALTAAMVVASLAISFKFGGLVENSSFRIGFNRPRMEMTEESRENYSWVREAIESIPPDASVSASRYLVPHMTTREHIHRFPRNWGSDYVFVNRRRVRPWGRVNIRLLERSDAYEVLREHNEFILLRRRPEVEMPERLPEPEERRRRSRRSQRGGR